MPGKLEPLHYELPNWLAEIQQSYTISQDIVARADYVISAARQSLAHGDGGPFAAALFDADSGELISLGVNLVTSSNCSVLHAEVVAILQAHAQLHTHDLSSSSKRYELIASTEPCTMCLGSIHWSGIQRLVCCATDADAREIGFDEGPKPADWADYLRERGVEVIEAVQRERAREVLDAYRKQGGKIYNAGV